MKKKILITVLIIVAMVCMFAISVSAAALAPQKPTLDVSFGDVTTIPDFVAPSELYVDTDERFVLDLGDGNYVTYPTYYITKNQVAFDVDFGKFNTALGGTSYSKANIAMLEIPEGITTINNSTFSGTGYTVCQYVQFPSTITTFGNNVFSTNKAAKIVEFVDGESDLAIGDNMFSGAWNGGTVIEYVKFPNNAVSIGNGTFGKTTTNKTIILGENLKSIGTNFFSESTPRTTDTFIYASTNFFADTAMFSNLFGSYDQHHNAHHRLTIFYTGTQAEAQAFIDKGLAVQTGYIWDTAVTLVSASDYVYDTHKPTQDKGLTMVYDYNICDAFYNSVHDENAPYYEFAGEKYISDLNECVACNKCDNTIKTKVADPAFISRGYSKDESAGSFMYDIVVNKKAMAIYTEKTGVTLSYGLVVSGNTTIDKLINEDATVASNDVLKIDFDGANYNKLQIKFTNVGANTTFKVHACAYVIETNNGAKAVRYIGDGTTKSTSTPISYSEIE